MPHYLGICFLFHPLIGWAATAGEVLLITITFATEYLTRKPAGDASRSPRAAWGSPKRAAAMPRPCRPSAWRPVG
jgi:ABC-type protease/lipase transport system fused ATPase/permease subunit